MDGWINRQIYGEREREKKEKKEKKKKNTIKTFIQLKPKTEIKC